MQTALGEVMHFQYPSNTFNPPSVLVPLSSFSSRPIYGDAWPLGVDYRGQPLFWKPQWINETKNDPYDINLSIGGSYQAYGSASADNLSACSIWSEYYGRLMLKAEKLRQRLWLLAGGNLITNPTLLGLSNQQAQIAVDCFRTCHDDR